MLNKMLALGVVAALAASPVMAGNASMKSADGTKLKIACTSGGCKVTAKKPDAKKWGVVERTKGGGKNYEMLHEKYKGMGFN